MEKGEYWSVLEWSVKNNPTWAAPGGDSDDELEQVSNPNTMHDKSTQTSKSMSTHYRRESDSTKNDENSTEQRCI